MPRNDKHPSLLCQGLKSLKNIYQTKKTELCRFFLFACLSMIYQEDPLNNNKVKGERFIAINIKGRFHNASFLS
jgi:hypothetical protein